MVSALGTRTNCGLPSSLLRYARHASQSNFYKRLNVPENANADTIKTAYRNLAKKYHPDLEKDTKKKEKKSKDFLKISEAYETLSDTKKKKEYDNRINQGQGSSGDGGYYVYETFSGDRFDRYSQMGFNPFNTRTANGNQVNVESLLMEIQKMKQQQMMRDMMAEMRTATLVEKARQDERRKIEEELRAQGLVSKKKKKIKDYFSSDK